MITYSTHKNPEVLLTKEEAMRQKESIYVMGWGRCIWLPYEGDYTLGHINQAEQTLKNALDQLGAV